MEADRDSPRAEVSSPAQVGMERLCSVGAESALSRCVW